MSHKKVTAIVPAYNEAEFIFETVTALVKTPSVTEVLVVDDASSDNTAVLAARAGARVMTLEKNAGKGAALNIGVQSASADIYLLLDGDLGTSASDAGLLLEPVLTGRADMTVAQFPPPRRKGGFGLVKGLARWGILVFTGQVMKSPLSGQRAMTRQVLDSVYPFASGYGVEVGMTIKAARLGYRVLEVPVQMTHAETGRDLKGFRHRGRQFWHITRTLLRVAVLK
ncbi:MAG TPA: glycosyltransferase family 2 protein [Desulfotomaculum sp.]|nr:MAG: glycosyl transferase [Peptococcaceae bacterium BRH_c8a]KJS78545.1 MAG: glycosyl transferase [Desulfotomaculum sp. BICA1-6]HBX24377.1 glycosyltransferase family 2 protein [Desulfotomaculum sp.]